MSYNRGRGFGFGGFTVKRPEIAPPPPNASLSKHGYHTLTSITNNALHGGAYGYGQVRKRPKTEDEYFAEEEEAADALDSDAPYQPAPGSPGPTVSGSAAGVESESDDDPLDAFMAGIEQQVKKEVRRSSAQVASTTSAVGSGGPAPPPAGVEAKGVRQDIDGEDNEESYYRYMEENPNAGRQLDESDDEMEYDEEGNPIITKKSKVIDPLPTIDHSSVKYPDFTKNFYQEHEDIAALDEQQVAELRRKLGISVTGFAASKPVSSFGHFGFDEALLKSVRKSEYTQPTPIQAQAVPMALSGRDIIGIAKTGSGKTAAFLWPLLMHIMDQPELAPGDGPIGLILAPTRELAQQIYAEAKKFGKVYNICVVCAYGGGSKWEQSKALEAGAELVVATPGRIIDMVKMKATNLSRVTFLVLDEADRMFDMGFEPQVRSICDHVRPDRQTLLFSATFKRKVERLARDALTDPIRIVQGELGEANEDIEQSVHIFNRPDQKWSWLIRRLVEYMAAGSVLIFVTRKANAEELSKNLKTKEFECLLLHGDMSQYERNDVITAFKKATTPILVATDVAARGLDIPHIRTVVNYDVARDIDTHTHRIGRTGRAGEKGRAVTLITDKDKEFSGHLVRNLEAANQDVSRELMDLAMTSQWFRKSRFKTGGKAKQLGGRGLGFKERPGLGSGGSSSSGGGGGGSIMASSVVSRPMGPAGQAYSGVADASGPATNRLSALRAAFEAQYKSQFTPSTADPSWSTTEEGAHYAKLAEREQQQHEQQEAETVADGQAGARRKKSRWHD